MGNFGSRDYSDLINEAQQGIDSEAVQDSLMSRNNGYVDTEEWRGKKMRGGSYWVNPNCHSW